MVGASLPLAKTILCTSGIRLREIHVTPIMDILAGYMLWPGRLMVRASLLEVAIKRSKYGMQANKRSVTPALSGWRSLYCLHILTAAHSPIIVSFVDSMAAAPVAVVPSSAGRQPALRLLRSLHERHVQCGHCECGARYTGLPTPPGQQGSRCQRYGSKVKGW